jgi:hypothetical protein
VYFTDPVDGAVLAVPRAGGDVAVLAHDRVLPSAIAVDDHDVYWVEDGDGGSVVRLTK